MRPQVDPTRSKSPNHSGFTGRRGGSASGEKAIQPIGLKAIYYCLLPAALKDRQEVAGVEREFTSVDEEYENARRAARAAVRRLSRVEQRCIYASIADSPWVVDGWSERTQEIQEALDRERIYSDSSDGWVLFANGDHPRMARALDAINSLRLVLQSPEAKDLRRHLEDDLECPVDVGNRDFFEAILVAHRLVD
jgi:hypothetical protein